MSICPRRSTGPSRLSLWAGLRPALMPSPPGITLPESLYRLAPVSPPTWGPPTRPSARVDVTTGKLEGPLGRDAPNGGPAEARVFLIAGWERHFATNEGPAVSRPPSKSQPKDAELPTPPEVGTHQGSTLPLVTATRASGRHRRSWPEAGVRGPELLFPDVLGSLTMSITACGSQSRPALCWPTHGE